MKIPFEVIEFIDEPAKRLPESVLQKMRGGHGVMGGEKAPGQYDTDIILEEHPEIAQDPDMLKKFLALDSDLIRNPDHVLFAKHAQLSTQTRLVNRLTYNLSQSA